MRAEQVKGSARGERSPQLVTQTWNRLGQPSGASGAKATPPMGSRWGAGAHRGGPQPEGGPGASHSRGQQPPPSSEPGSEGQGGGGPPRLPRSCSSRLQVLYLFSRDEAAVTS